MFVQRNIILKYLFFRREAASVNSNLQVRKLKDDLYTSDHRYDEMIKVY